MTVITLKLCAPIGLTVAPLNLVRYSKLKMVSMQSCVLFVRRQAMVCSLPVRLKLEQYIWRHILKAPFPWDQWTRLCECTEHISAVVYHSECNASITNTMGRLGSLLNWWFVCILPQFQSHIKVAFACYKEHILKAPSDLRHGWAIISFSALCEHWWN